MRALFTLSVLFFALAGCTGGKSSASVTMPKAHIPQTAKAVVDLFFEGDVRPGMSREAKSPMTTPAQAYTQLKKLFPKYADKVECYTVIKDFFVFSITPDATESDAKETPCYYSLEISGANGSKALKYYWLLKQ